MKQEPKTPAKAIDPKEQAQLFDKAVTLFKKQDFARARELFEQAAAGPAAEMAHSAQMHASMCERRIARSAAPALQHPEDHYTYGVSLMSRGELETAEQSLKKALSLRPEADHYHYALALCTGLRGNVEGAAQHLRRAIELQPSNRIAARNDAEFQSLAQHAPIRELLQPERGHSG